MNTGSFSGIGEAVLNGAADGFMVGAITGAIVGDIHGYCQVQTANLSIKA